MREQTPWQERLETLATACRLQDKPLRLNPSDAMFFGKHKNQPVERVCKLEPSYMHYLIREGIVLATKELCSLIQQGYNAEATRLNAQYGPIGHGTTWKYVPIPPAQAPTPTEE